MQAQSRIVRNEFPWGVIEWLAGGEVGNSTELSLARVSLPPGKVTDTHVHGNCEESVYVTRGRVECTAGGRSALLSAGELTVVPRGAVHGLRNAGAEPAEVILSYSSPAREFKLA
ncbi:MAG: cupin domain-containing protein [Candidatus Rokubacteria bacterium]|nr:cupin domain-containing protein [Candidatus Rokubacteria bacterium]MBI4627152.1 cupin domain-containing protein [Candidatus Rokubacteria bacterium]